MADQTSFMPGSSSVASKTTNVLMVIAVIAVVASVINLVGVLDLSSTANAVEEEQGNVSVQIVDSLNIIFTVNQINWTSGYVDPASPINAAILNSNGTNLYGAAGTNWVTAPVTQGLELQNIGNVVADLWLRTDKNATDFICGTVPGCTNPEFQWRLEQDNADGSGIPGSCTTPMGTGNPWTGYVTVFKDTSGDGDAVCQSFNTQGSGTNEIEIDVRVRIPNDAFPEPKIATITAGAEKH